MKTPQRVVMLGGRGVGMIAASVLDRLGGYEMVGFLNDELEPGTAVGKYRQFPVLGPSTDVHEVVREHDAMIFVAYLGMTREREVGAKLATLSLPEERLLTIVDPTAVVPHGFCEIGRGCLLAPLSQLSTDTTLGDNVVLLPNSFVGHDSVLADQVSVANNATVGGAVTVGRGVHIGTNASIREFVDIGEHAVVGMGSVVLDDVPADAIVAGSPARVIRVKSAA